MRGYKPNTELWERVNKAILGSNAAEAIVTIQSGLCQLLIHSGVVADEPTARAHLAAMLLSPDTSEKPGSLLPLVQAEIARLNDGKWVQ